MEKANLEAADPGEGWGGPALRQEQGKEEEAVQASTRPSTWERRSGRF